MATEKIMIAIGVTFAMAYVVLVIAVNKEALKNVGEWFRIR
jgi:hypothetical protein